MSLVDRVMEVLMLGAFALLGGGAGIAWGLRRGGFRWTWALPGLPLSLLVLARIDVVLGPLGFLAFGLAAGLGAKWHWQDVRAGADHAEIAHARLGIGDVLGDLLDRHRRNGGFGFLGEGEGVGGLTTGAGLGTPGRVDASDERLEVGRDRRGRAAWIPAGLRAGSHTLIVGATGSGKTVSEAAIDCALIEAEHGASLGSSASWVAWRQGAPPAPRPGRSDGRTDLQGCQPDDVDRRGASRRLPNGLDAACSHDRQGTAAQCRRHDERPRGGHGTSHA